MVFSRFRSSFQKRHQRDSSSCVFQSFESFSGEGKKQHSWNCVFNVLNRFPRRQKTTQLKLCFNVWIVFRRRQKQHSWNCIYNALSRSAKHTLLKLCLQVCLAQSRRTQKMNYCVRCVWSVSGRLIFRCLWTWRPAFLSHPHMSNKSRYKCLYYYTRTCYLISFVYSHLSFFVVFALLVSSLLWYWGSGGSSQLSVFVLLFLFPWLAMYVVSGNSQIPSGLPPCCVLILWFCVCQFSGILIWGWRGR